MEMKKGCIFACTDKSFNDCIKYKVFGTNKLYSEKVSKVKKGDVLFLINIDTDILYGPFFAESDGGKNLAPQLWDGKYPYQVLVSQNGEIKSVEKISAILKKLRIAWKEKTINEKVVDVLIKILNGEKVELEKVSISADEEDDKPKLESTTLWDYPKQSYGKTPKGNNKYPGVTPAFIIYNLIKRYTEPGDIVLDPMAGSGTTIDVCKEEGRRFIAFDISPTRPDIIQCDARSLPVKDEVVDMIFIDSPYGDNIHYNDHPLNIGKISAEKEQFYDELEKVMAECYRVLKPGKIIAWLIGDQWVKKKFTPVGFKVFERLCKYFEPVDVIAVARRNQTSNTGIWHNRALKFNFYLRGFKYLHIMRKPESNKNSSNKSRRKINWTMYERK